MGLLKTAAKVAVAPASPSRVPRPEAAIEAPALPSVVAPRPDALVAALPVTVPLPARCKRMAWHWWRAGVISPARSFTALRRSKQMLWTTHQERTSTSRARDGNREKLSS